MRSLRSGRRLSARRKERNKPKMLAPIKQMREQSGGNVSMKSKRSVLANRFAAKENWTRTNSGRDLARARTRGLPLVILSLLAFCALLSATCAQVSVYEVTPVESIIKFGVESSVPIKGTFDKWNATLKFSSTDVRSAVLDIEIQADSVNTGSGIKNKKLKSKDFFNVK